ncbi:MAG: ABC transporter permease, partial [Muribaculaceae bacterium]|nr:ABC transporter permease [Muribaculaceae bacterium]
MKKIKSLLRQLFDVYCREFKIVSKDMGMILFFTFLPLAYPIVYSLIYNPELVREVDLIIVDHDRTPMSRKLVRSMDATQEANVIGYAADLNEARRAMDNRDCFGILEIPEGFQRNLGINEQAKAVMYCDMSLLLRYKGLLIASTNVSQELGSQITFNRIDEIVPLATTIATGDPLPIENVALGNTEGGFDSFIMPGVVVLILQQCI